MARPFFSVLCSYQLQQTADSGENNGNKSHKPLLHEINFTFHVQTESEVNFHLASFTQIWPLDVSVYLPQTANVPTAQTVAIKLASNCLWEFVCVFVLSIVHVLSRFAVAGTLHHEEEIFSLLNLALHELDTHALPVQTSQRFFFLQEEQPQYLLDAHFTVKEIAAMYSVSPSS